MICGVGSRKSMSVCGPCLFCSVSVSQSLCLPVSPVFPPFLLHLQPHLQATHDVFNTQHHQRHQPVQHQPSSSVVPSPGSVALQTHFFTVNDQSSVIPTFLGTLVLPGFGSPVWGHGSSIFLLHIFHFFPTSSPSSSMSLMFEIFST